MGIRWVVEDKISKEFIGEARELKEVTCPCWIEEYKIKEYPAAKKAIIIKAITVTLLKFTSVIIKTISLIKFSVKGPPIFPKQARNQNKEKIGKIETPPLERKIFREWLRR